MKLDGPPWIMQKLREAIAEHRFFVCTDEEMQAHGDLASAKLLGLIHVGWRAGNTPQWSWGHVDRGWYRYYPATGLVRGKKVNFVTRTERGWLDSVGYEYLDHEVRKPETRS